MQNIPIITLPLHSIVQVTFLLFLVIYVVFSSVLYYHWSNYSLDKTATIHTYLAYFLISLPLLAIMGFSMLVI